MKKRLVIVESPTKAKTLRRFLGKDFIVESSIGHVRDLPASAAEIPEEVKGEPWARLGVNVEEEFEPLYVVSPEKRKVIAGLKARLKEAGELLLATDEDREGEAISWHLVQVLHPKMPMRRMVFHEITRDAVLAALESTRDIDENMVEAYKARRIIDRLYGYEVSPMLWRKVAPRLSAGRVQSVAIRMIVERELERMRFRSAGFWDLAAEFQGKSGGPFAARLASLGGKRLADGRDFDPQTGLLARDDVAHLEGAAAAALADRLRGADFRVLSTEEKPFSQAPAPPFTTSTLQQEGGRKLRFDARRTMRAAQRLYEMGYITYMRTDSVALAPEAVKATRAAVERLYGKEFLPEEQISYVTRVKNAQEAHEAIRPTGENFPTPSEIAASVSPDELRVYELIWMRTMACQMKKAQGRRMTVRIGAGTGAEEAVFQANGKSIDFPGFLRAYVEGSDDPDAEISDQETILPPLEAGDAVTAAAIAAEEHATQPPPRLTEASLVKALEESGIGRPSTYASIIETIQRREYTFKKGSALVPTFTAFAVVKLMTEHLAYLIDFDFTAKMEDRLDSIARGEHEALPYLREFYFGNGVTGLRPLLERKEHDIDPRAVCSIPIAKTAEGEEIVVRVGRFGPFLQQGEATAPLPDDICPDEISLERALEILAASKEGPQVLGKHPETGEPVYVRVGRFGPYVQLGDSDAKLKKKPKMISLFGGLTPETVTLADALRLLSLPRTLGKDTNGVDVIAHYGRYGAYIKRGPDTRSLAPTDDVLTIELPRALELLAQEKRSQRSAPATLKVFEKVAALDGADIKLMNGRYGPYVSDGETNASLPRDTTDPTALTEGEAVQLILDRRSRGGGRKRRARRPAAKRGARAGAPAEAAATGEAVAPEGAEAAAPARAARPQKRRAPAKKVRKKRARSTE
ncbi:MAG: type I DNA topoisomerase [Planctomycetes bacterium]|nr:type I DNA topoisomerase [Planctomycetota bacterium]